MLVHHKAPQLSSKCEDNGGVQGESLMVRAGLKTLSSRQQHLKEYWRGLDIGWSKVEECTRGVEAAGVFRPVTTDPAG